MSALPEYILERTFAASREKVWQAWTDPELLARWYGPGVETIIHQFDLTAGGEWRNEMKMGDKSMLSKMVFQEVVPQEKIVWLHSSTDENWNVISSPMMPNWPRILLTTVTFQDMGEDTLVRLTQVPVEASEAEIACFADMMGNMDGGWGKGYAVIDEILS